MVKTYRSTLGPTMIKQQPVTQDSNNNQV